MYIQRATKMSPDHDKHLLIHAAFDLPYPLLGLCLAVCGDRLARSLAKVNNVDGKAPNGLSYPMNDLHRTRGTPFDFRSDAVVLLLLDNACLFREILRGVGLFTFVMI